MKTITIPALLAAIGGAGLSPLSASNVAGAQAVASTQITDTATVQLHISGMTCGTCPLTARKALDKLAGVYGSTVTYADSLGVVKFDPRKVKPAEIAAHLTKMTGYGARVLPDSIKIRKS
jgi:mercuric ion binding protein